jgi:ASC-1-like (ASCH) protein
MTFRTIDQVARSGVDIFKAIIRKNGDIKDFELFDCFKNMLESTPLCKLPDNLNIDKIHVLKLDYSFFDLIVSDKKRFEIRKNDSDFKAGDGVIFKEFISDAYKCRRTSELYVIDCVLTDDDFIDGIQPGYCVLSLKKYQEAV